MRICSSCICFPNIEKTNSFLYNPWCIYVPIILVDSCIGRKGADHLFEIVIIDCAVGTFPYSRHGLRLWSYLLVSRFCTLYPELFRALRAEQHLSSVRGVRAEPSRAARLGLPSLPRSEPRISKTADPGYNDTPD